MWQSLSELVYRHSVATLRYSAALARRMGLGLTDLHALEHLAE